MKKSLLTIIVAAFIPASGFAASEQFLADKAVRAAQVLDEVLKMEDNSIPKSLLQKAVCIAVLPDVVKGGFVFGARVGRAI